MPVRIVRQKLVRGLGHEGEPELFKLLVRHLQLLLYPLLDGGEQLTLAERRWKVRSEVKSRRSGQIRSQSQGQDQAAEQLIECQNMHAIRETMPY